MPTVGDVVAAFFAGGHQAEAAEGTIGPTGAALSLGPPGAEPELEISL